MFAKLTETNGSYSLPVARTVVRLDGIVEETPDAKRVRVSLLSPAERTAYGWYELIEDSFDDSYQRRGIYVDTINGIIINRSFPNPIPKDAAGLIEAKEVVLLSLRNDKKDATTTRYLSLQELDAIFSRPAPPTSRVYVDEDGEPMLINATIAKTEYNSVIDYRQAVDQAYMDNLNELRALTDPQMIAQFDVEQRWP